MNKKIPMRQCVGCGEMKNKKDLLRIIGFNWKKEWKRSVSLF